MNKIIHFKKIVVLMGFVIFAVIVNELSNYLIGIVPPPQLAPIDMFSYLHAFTVAGLAFFGVALTDDKLRTKRNIFLFIIFLVVAWEVVENTVLRGMPISGGESLANSCADIVIGIAMSGGVFLNRFGIRPKNNIDVPRSKFL